MIKILKNSDRLMITLGYFSTVASMCLVVLFFILKIQNQYAGDLINLRFNVYEGITVIDSANYVWQYLIYSTAFSIINGLSIWYLQYKYRFTKSKIKYIIIYWIFGSSVLVLSLFIAYLWLVLSINS
ncbi:MAG: hypothetical protein RLZZ223_325 [Candidatus Parcubacteria bacterium]|jgi:hypothetical protein